MGARGDMHGLLHTTGSREHMIMHCTGKLVGRDEPCGRMRKRVVRLLHPADYSGLSHNTVEAGEAMVCLNPECQLYTRLDLVWDWVVAARQP